jgi:hypothetical protein
MRSVWGEDCQNLIKNVQKSGRSIFQNFWEQIHKIEVKNPKIVHFKVFILIVVFVE